MSYFMIRPCSTSAAYFATLRRHRTLNLADARAVLEGGGYRVTDCGVLLIIHGEPERTLYRTGRVLVKTGEEAAAREAAEELYRLLDVTPKAEMGGTT